MNYTTEQKQALSNLADKFETNADRVERMANKIYESDTSASFDEILTAINEVLYDHQQDMEMDAWEGSEEYEGDYDE